MSQNNKRQLWPAASHALRGHCPACGQGKLYQAYLKPVDACSNCAEPLSEIRADDGPTWLTVLITGHLMAFLIVPFVMNSTMPSWMMIMIVTPVVLALILLILPRAKSLFIAILWTQQDKSAEPDIAN